VADLINRINAGARQFIIPELTRDNPVESGYRNHQIRFTLPAYTAPSHPLQTKVEDLKSLVSEFDFVAEIKEPHSDQITVIANVWLPINQSI
jgi:hypothetical protein